MASTSNLRRRGRGRWIPWAAVLLLFAVLSGGQGWGLPGRPEDQGGMRTAVLDRVVAVVGEQAILASDVDEELRYAALQPGPEPAEDNTPQRALQRVIDRTLINEQRALQPGVGDVSQQKVNDAIATMRRTIPACAPAKCATEAGWQAFLAAHGFTQAEVEDRVRERLEILQFIQLRFGVAARAPNAEVQKYYDQVLKPELERHHAAVPQLSAVASRIREILREQQVDALVERWIEGLRSDEEVRILDPAYGSVGGGSSGRSAGGNGGGA